MNNMPSNTGELAAARYLHALGIRNPGEHATIGGRVGRSQVISVAVLSRLAGGGKAEDVSSLLAGQVRRENTQKEAACEPLAWLQGAAGYVRGQWLLYAGAIVVCVALLVWFGSVVAKDQRAEQAWRMARDAGRLVTRP